MRWRAKRPCAARSGLLVWALHLALAAPQTRTLFLMKFSWLARLAVWAALVLTVFLVAWRTASPLTGPAILSIGLL